MKRQSRKLLRLLTFVLRYLIMGKGAHCTSGARFQTGGEVRQLLSSRHQGLLMDGQQGRLSEAESFKNVCVIARVGAGKTSRYIIPNVLDKATKNCSLVVNDPKGEVYEQTAGYLQAHGFQVLLIDLEDLSASQRFNPLDAASSDIELEQIAEILIKA